jgi:hypothetical protein
MPGWALWTRKQAESPSLFSRYSFARNRPRATRDNLTYHWATQ